MSTDLRASAHEYLKLRRAMGYRLDAHDRLIGALVDYLCDHDQHVITVQHALAWACLPEGTAPRWHAARLAAVRGFAAHVWARDPHAAQLIPTGLLSARVRRAVPYLYSDDDVAGLLEAARQLQPPVRAHTMVAIISLMASVGLRTGEALALDTSDLDVVAGVLSVTGKYGKKRHLPVHSSTVEGLSSYLRRSRQLVGHPRDGSLFVTVNAT